MANQQILDLLGDKAEFLLNHDCKTNDKSTHHLPSSTLIDDIWITGNRNNHSLCNFHALLNYGRLEDTGYCSIPRVNHDTAHSREIAFAPNPIYCVPENINKLAFKSGCNTVAN